QNVGRVDLDELLVRVLAPALGRHAGHRALQNLQQRLLHALARHVAGDGRVFRLAGDFVHLVDVDDAAFGLFHVVVGGLDELEQNVLHVFAHVARLGQRGGVRNGEGHVEDAGQGLGQQRLAAARGAQQQDVALLQLHVVGPHARVDPLVVVVHRHRQRLLGRFLADYVLVEDLLDFLRPGYVAELDVDFVVHLFLDDLVAQLDALVANVDARPGDELLDLLLPLAAEGALELALFVAEFEHRITPRLVGLRGSLLQHTVDDAVLQGFLGGHVEVAIRVPLDAFHRLPGVLDQDVVERLLDAQNFPGLNLDLRGLASHAAQRLVDHDPRVGQREPLALRARRQQHRRHAGRHAHADGGHVGLDVLHRIIDRQTRIDYAARAVDIQVDVLVRVLRFQEQQLRDDQIRHVVVDGAADKDDAVLQQPRVYIIRALSPVGLLHDHRYQNTHVE